MKLAEQQIDQGKCEIEELKTQLETKGQIIQDLMDLRKEV